MTQLNLFESPDESSPFNNTKVPASERPNEWWLVLLRGPRHLWDEEPEMVPRDASPNQPSLPF